MFQIIKDWIKFINIKKAQAYIYIVTSFAEILCYVFLPFSFAQIITATTAQQIHLAYLWATTNFFTHILNTITHNFKTTLLTNLMVASSTTKNCSSEIKETVDQITNYAIPLNNSIMLILKIFTIIIILCIYSWYLALYLLIAIIFCSILSFLIQKHSLRKKISASSQNKTLSHVSNNKSLLIDTAWSIFTFIITLIIIEKTSNLKITITAFLLLTTFINTHLMKPNFNINILTQTKLLKINMQKYYEYQNNK